MNERGYSRRAVTIGGGIAAALGIAALGITVPRLFGRHYRKTPYDDVFAHLVDRDAATKVGEALNEGRRGAPGGRSWAALAQDLRQRLERRTLAEVTNADVAEGRLIEVKGWVMPETVVLIGALSASQS